MTGHEKSGSIDVVQNMFHLDKTSVCSFGQRDVSGASENGDSGEYVFEIAPTMDGTSVLSSMSDNTLTITSTEELRAVCRTKAHKATINHIEASRISPSLLYSCADDKKVYGWDVRCFEKPVLQISHQDEVAAVSVGISGTLLASACGSSIFFFDIRAFDGNSTSAVNGRKLGIYSDIHSDTITQLKFHPTQGHILASAAEDGLICACDTSVQAEEDAVVSILNTECPVGRFGYFGTDNEGIYSVSTVETLSFWHFPSAQRVAHFPTIREDLRADYLVDCFSAPNTNDIYLMAGDFNGQGVVAQMQPSRFDILGYLHGGHTANIRCATASFATTAGSPRLITGGEDARLCSWKPSQAGNVQAAVSTIASAAAQPSPSHGARVSPISGSSSGSLKVKKDSSKLRFKPY
jgi:WD40 repeat protein